MSQRKFAIIKKHSLGRQSFPFLKITVGTPEKVLCLKKDGWVLGKISLKKRQLEFLGCFTFFNKKIPHIFNCPPPKFLH